ncbi:MAG: CPBP family intramembrane glutamic endopeptidase [Myxococcota bacterium]
MVLWRRFLIAACVLAGGLMASGWVRGLALAERGNRARMGFEMGGIEVGVLALALALAIALPGSVPRRLGLQPSRLSHWAFAAVVLGTLGLSLAMNALVDAMAVAEGSNMTGISRGLAAPPDARSIWIAVFGTALLPGIAEELLCRGVVQRSLVAWIHPLVAIAVSTLLFGALHMELVHGGVAFLIGLYLAVTAFWADSTRPAIAAHVANNGLALAGSVGFLQLRATHGTMLVLGLGLAAAGAYAAYRHRLPRGPRGPRGEARKDPGNAPEDLPEPGLQQRGKSAEV